MLIHSKNLLMAGKKYYTLTVVTNPASATCTLTYDGQSYSSKTATVEEGTIIGYSIYHSTYGTQTGSITIDSDKTLTATGTYSTTTIATSWTQPILSSNGTLGGSSFACYGAMYGSTYYAWHAFDNNSKTYWQGASGGTDFIFYNPTAIKVSSMTIQYYSSTYIPNSISFHGSNNNSSYTSLSFSGDTSGTTRTYTISSGSRNYYKYYKITCGPSNSGQRVTCIVNLSISATYQTTSYTYYWDITTS